MLALPLSLTSFSALSQLLGRPQWLTVSGRSQTYVKKVMAAVEARGGAFRTNTEVTGVQSLGEEGVEVRLRDGTSERYDSTWGCRAAAAAEERSNLQPKSPLLSPLHCALPLPRRGSVDVRLEDGTSERYDRVVLAVHGDAVLPLLGEGTTAEERRVFSAFRYATRRQCDDASLVSSLETSQKAVCDDANAATVGPPPDSVTHPFHATPSSCIATSPSCLPTSGAAWSAWNFIVTMPIPFNPYPPLSILINTIFLHCNKPLMPTRGAAWSAWKFSTIFLHRDKSLMPTRRAAWSAWNFRGVDAKGGVCVTYWLNTLQNLGDTGEPIMVTLNPPSGIKGTVHHQWVTSHPLPTTAATAAARLLPTVQGRRGIYFCGAYLGYGFHEDGFKAGLTAANSLLGASSSPALQLQRNTPQMLLPLHYQAAKTAVLSFLRSFIHLGSVQLLERGGTVYRFGRQGPKLDCQMTVHSPAFFTLHHPPSPLFMLLHTPFTLLQPLHLPPGCWSEEARCTAFSPVLYRPVYLQPVPSPWYLQVATRADLGLADAFVDGDISFPQGSRGLLKFLEIVIANRDRNNQPGQRPAKKKGWWRPALLTAVVGSAALYARHVLRFNNLTNARRNISNHYDLSNGMFQTFLDETMTYSCAIFQRPEEPLVDAQLRKLRRLIAKTHLTTSSRSGAHRLDPPRVGDWVWVGQLGSQPFLTPSVAYHACPMHSYIPSPQARIDSTHHVLEIGFGWGSLALETVSLTGCRYTGITLSSQQLQLATERVKAAGLQDRINFMLCDYRNLPGTGKFDRILSCEMLEAVGHEYLGDFFHHCDRLLAMDGLLVVQVITTPESRYEEYRLSSDFIKEYIFPGCCVPSLSALTNAMAKSSAFSVEELENIGPHYATTLMRWHDNFMAHRHEIMEMGFGPKFIRTWQYYFVYCAVGFQTRTLGDIQVVFSRPGNATLDLVPYTKTE
ncbi:unnamed protein product [Closterium sp. Naga37s-1]|nr:unnamed protein product [Closterium sp. Naga37s-1]